MTTSDHASAQPRFRPTVPALVFALMTAPAMMHASIAFTFRTVAGGVTMTGATTNTGGLNFGTVSRYKTIGTANLTRTLGASDYTLSTPMAVRVTKSTESSTSYTLQARLGTASVHTWKVHSVTLSTTYANLVVAEPYASNRTHTLEMVITNAQTTGLSVSQTINFLAIAN